MDSQTKLTKLRTEIDAIDQELLEVLAKRFAIVDQIGKLKKEMHVPPLDKNRWDQVIAARMNTGANLGMDKAFVKSIYDTIHAAALKLEA